MRIHFIPKDFENANYMSSTNCPLAKALKREFPYSKIKVTGFSSFIDNYEFKIPNNWDIQKVYEIKEKLPKFKPFSLNLKEK